MKRIILVYNPRSSRFAEVKTDVIDKVYALKGYMIGKYEVEKTDVDKNSAKLAKILKNGDLVLSAGGDATAQIAANSIIKSNKDVTLAVLPYGNFNDLSRTLQTDTIEQIFNQKNTTRKLYPLEIIVDGSHGEVIENPSDGEIAIYREKTIEYKKEKEELKKFIGKETVTADGVKVELCCNIGKPDDADAVLSKDGEGVGLFRTEFLYMDSSSIPTEEEQFEAYKKTVLKLGDKPLIIRTLDVGGDKDIPYLGLSKEDNPFMGFRAVRYCLHREDVYKPQLRALLRASAFGNIKIMIPLVTCIDEVREVKAMIENIKAELDSENIAYNKDIQVGVMVETPAASLIADLLAEEADFFSIGTNDLTGYTMAVDRGNADVAYLYSAFQPAVLRSIKKIIEDGKDIMVGMCGEAAADPLLIPLLLAFGLDEFSVSATSVLKTRKIISQWTIDEAKEVANKALTLKTESEVVEYLTSVAK